MGSMECLAIMSNGEDGTSIQLSATHSREAIWICNRLFQKIKNNSIIMEDKIYEIQKKAIFLIGFYLAAIIIISGASYAFASNSGPHNIQKPQIGIRFASGS